MKDSQPFGQRMVRIIVDILHNVSSNNTMTAIRQGLINMMPILIIGSFSILFNNLPIPAFQNFMTSVFGSEWKSAASSIYSGTIQIMSLGILLSISYSLAKSKQAVKQREINAVTVALVSLGCLITISHIEDNALKFSQLGATGLFVAVLVAVFSSLLFFFFYEHRIFKAKLITDEADALFTQSVSALEPAIETFLVFCGLRFVFSFFGISDVHTFIYDVLKAFFSSMENGLEAAVVFTFMSQLFWFFGLHGSNVLENVSQELWVPMLEKNIADAQAGLIPTEIFTKPFFDVFTKLGGSGSTLCLIIALLLTRKKTNSSRLAKLSMPLALFNINETMIYGLPIVLNPFYIIPFLLGPVVMLLVSYFATALHLVPVVTNAVSWTTPILIGGYTATGSISGLILQLVNLCIGVAIYMPFIALSEKSKNLRNSQTLSSLNEQIQYIDNYREQVILNRFDEVGYLARVLAGELKNAIEDNGLFLVFQPQINSKGEVFGCETLVRWNHPQFGFVPPPTFITLAEEAKIDDKLNEWIFEEALKMQKKLTELGYDHLVFSINLSPLQLKNERLIDLLDSRIREYKLNPDKIEIELTENIMLDDSTQNRIPLERLKELGVRLAIDDFGMGHTSLQYLRSFAFDTVKLDGSLVEDILTDKSVSDIVKAIIDLTSNLGIDVIAEVVETKEQRDALCEMGCGIFQGYYYSKPLTKDNYIEFLASFHNKESEE